MIRLKNRGEKQFVIIFSSIVVAFIIVTAVALYLETAPSRHAKNFVENCMSANVNWEVDFVDVIFTGILAYRNENISEREMSEIYYYVEKQLNDPNLLRLSEAIATLTSDEEAEYTWRALNIYNAISGDLNAGRERTGEFNFRR